MELLKESADLVILGVMFGAKMTFEKHLHFVSSVASQHHDIHLHMNNDLTVLVTDSVHTVAQVTHC